MREQDIALQQEDTRHHMPVTAERAAFVNKVFIFFGAALGLTAVGSYGGFMLAASNPALMFNPFISYGSIIAMLALVFTARMWQEKVPANYALFAILALVMGFMLTPLLTIAGIVGGGMLIAKALLATTFTFAAAGIYGWVTKKDLSSMGPILMISLIGIIVMGIVNMFLQSNTFEIILSSIGIILFTAFTAYDIQNIKARYPDHMYIMAAIALYLSFINLFQNILSLLISLNRD